MNGDKEISITEIQNLSNKEIQNTGTSLATAKSIQYSSSNQIIENSSTGCTNVSIAHSTIQNTITESSQKFANNTTYDSEQNIHEFTDQCDQQAWETLETKMKNSKENAARQLFNEGKQKLRDKKFDVAVVILKSTCKKYRSMYGDLAAECGEVFFTFGEAMLQYWRSENWKMDSDEVGDDSDIEQMEESSSVRTLLNESVGFIVIEEMSDNDEETTLSAENDEELYPEQNNFAEIFIANDTLAEEYKQLQLYNLRLARKLFEAAKYNFVNNYDEMNLIKAYTKLAEVAILSENREITIGNIIAHLNIDLKIIATGKPHPHLKMNNYQSQIESKIKNAQNTLKDLLFFAEDNSNFIAINELMKGLKKFAIDVSQECDHRIVAVHDLKIKNIKNEVEKQKRISLTDMGADSLLEIIASVPSPCNSYEVGDNSCSSQKDSQTATTEKNIESNINRSTDGIQKCENQENDLKETGLSEKEITDDENECAKGKDTTSNLEDKEKSHLIMRENTSDEGTVELATCISIEKENQKRNIVNDNLEETENPIKKLRMCVKSTEIKDEEIEQSAASNSKNQKCEYQTIDETESKFKKAA